MPLIIPAPQAKVFPDHILYLSPVEGFPLTANEINLFSLKSFRETIIIEGHTLFQIIKMLEVDNPFCDGETVILI
jgi:hypothetical protein